MKTTILAFHPNLTKTSRINATLAKAAQQAGYEVRDMYQLYPDFKIDVAKEQAILAQTDRIVLQFPIYWYQTPALVKQWFDDVLTYGWAYGSTGKALQGKEVLLAVSFGADKEDYTSLGRFHITVDEILKPIETISYHTGLKFLTPFVITGAMQLNEASLDRRAKSFVEILSE